MEKIEERKQTTGTLSGAPLLSAPTLLLNDFKVTFFGFILYSVIYYQIIWTISVARQSSVNLLIAYQFECFNLWRLTPRL